MRCVSRRAGKSVCNRNEMDAEEAHARYCRSFGGCIGGDYRSYRLDQLRISPTRAGAAGIAYAYAAALGGTGHLRSG